MVHQQFWTSILVSLALFAVAAFVGGQKYRGGPVGAAPSGGSQLECGDRSAPPSIPLVHNSRGRDSGLAGVREFNLEQAFGSQRSRQLREGLRER
jgi:hypothetical protein